MWVVAPMLSMREYFIEATLLVLRVLMRCDVAYQ